MYHRHPVVSAVLYDNPWLVIYLKGHKSISIFSSLITIHLLTTRLAILKHSATVAREARVQAQEVGVSNLTRFSQGDTGWGYLQMA